MKQKISIIGGGSCALMLACELDSEKFKVSIFEKNATPYRKFLVAGEGGLNLTHSEAPEIFISRYTPPTFLEKSFNHFNNRNLVKWLNVKGIETFVGSSGRVFPKKGMKPITVLNILTATSKRNNVAVFPKHEWKGFTSKNELIVKHNGAEKIIKSDYVVFCLGGASWPVTGSDGTWLEHFRKKNIAVNGFAPSNCMFTVNWPKEIISKIEGKALKNFTFTCGGKINHGEVVLTTTGIEGGGIYPLSPQIREQLKAFGGAEIFIDLKPSLTLGAVLQKLRTPNGNNSYTKHIAEQLNLNPLHITLLKTLISKEDFLNSERLAYHIKTLKLSVTGTGLVEDAISSVGGIDLREIDPDFELKKMPCHFVIGEMLDFDAPTGGYLLQSCFTMAKSLADFLNSMK